MDKEQLKKFISIHDESEVLDFKENMDDACAIGEYISALGNSALLTHNPAAYMIWGVHDLSKKIVGTKFNPKRDYVNKKNRMPLITFLEQFLDPRINLKWDTFAFKEGPVVCLTIDVTGVNRPIRFKGDSFIRSGSSKKNLAEFPEKERQLWKSFESSKFELEYAAVDLTWQEIVCDLNTAFYATALGISDTDKLIKSLINDNIIVPTGSHFNVTNLGAYTLANDLKTFPYLQRKTIRITRYHGDQNFDNAVFDKIGSVGIAVSFNNVIKVIMQQLPYREDYTNGIREDKAMFPQIVIRELVANALVHQDFTVTGSRPFVEIYDSRVEISNPGTPLIKPERFLDYKPRSRNDELADILGKLRIVESRGTGIDKVVNALEENGLPAMQIIIQGTDTTLVKLTRKRSFKEMSTDEKNQSIYWHACLKYVEGTPIDNRSIRSRFRLDKNSSTAVSKALNSALDTGLIKIYDPSAGRKFVKYIPFWGETSAGK